MLLFLRYTGVIARQILAYPPGTTTTTTKASEHTMSNKDQQFNNAAVLDAKSSKNKLYLDEQQTVQDLRSEMPSSLKMT